MSFYAPLVLAATAGPDADEYIQMNKKRIEVGRIVGWGPRLRSMILIAVPWGLIACSHSAPGGGASQVVAKVNKTEITVLQLNAALARVPNVTPETAKAATGPVLQQLIDEELLVEKARDAKLDRNPGVVQAIEEAKRGLLANAWLQQAASGSAPPTDDDIKSYFTQHPEYFSARRVYEYRSIPVHATPQQVQDIEKQLAGNPNVDALLNNLRANKIGFIVNQFTKSAEQLPEAVVARFAKLQDGDSVTFPYSEGIEVVQLLNARPEPVDEVQARPFIKKYLIEQARKQKANKELEGLRAAANIQYVGDYSALGANKAAAAPPKPTPHPSASDAVTGIGSGIK